MNEVCRKSKAQSEGYPVVGDAPKWIKNAEEYGLVEIDVPVEPVGVDDGDEQ